MPARSSLWTGQYTHTTGSRDNQHPLRDDRASMTYILHKAGYTLGIFGKNHCFTAPQLERWFAANYSSGSRQWNEALTPEVAGQVKALREWIADHGGATMSPEAHTFPPEVCDTHLSTQRAIEFIGLSSRLTYLDLGHLTRHYALSVSRRLSRAPRRGRTVRRRRSR
jgi:hypothetical protein